MKKLINWLISYYESEEYEEARGISLQISNQIQHASVVFLPYFYQ